MVSSHFSIHKTANTNGKRFQKKLRKLRKMILKNKTHCFGNRLFVYNWATLQRPPNKKFMIFFLFFKFLKIQNL